jgi:hypothetical protein
MKRWHCSMCVDEDIADAAKVENPNWFYKAEDVEKMIQKIKRA